MAAADLGSPVQYLASHYTDDEGCSLFFCFVFWLQQMQMHNVWKQLEPPLAQTR